MKFTDYEASFITPQMTLLEKMHALCKFLELQEFEFSGIYKHTIITSSNLKFIFFNTSSKNDYTYDDFNAEDFAEKQIVIKNGNRTIITVNRSSNKNVFIFYTGDHFENIQFSSGTIVSQECELQ